MDPSFWGTSTWRYLHSLTFNYPTNPTTEDKIKYYNYFNQLSDFLPCPSCAMSYKIYFRHIPINEYLDDVYGITYWLYLIHFIVNQKLSKPNTNFNTVVKMYLANKTNCSVKPVNVSAKCTKKSSIEPDISTSFVKLTNDKYYDKSTVHIRNLFNYLKDHPIT